MSDLLGHDRWRAAAVVGVLVVTVLALLPAEVRAASALVRQQRLVHRFDFEGTDAQGRKLGRGHEWPQHWYGIGRPAKVSDPHFHRQPLHQQLIDQPGYPRHTEIRYDDQHVTSGDFSFMISLDGGNAGTYLEIGTLPAVPGSDYLITAKVRTEDLERARGRLTAYFVSDKGRRIDASVQRTEPIHTQGEWTTVAVKLTGDSSEAAWLGLELSIHQPRPDENHPLGDEQVVLTDVKGSAWFDDISVWQVPHVELRTQSAVNMIHAPEAPRVEARVRDLSGRQLLATLRVYDHRMREVDSERFIVGQGAPMRWQWEPSLPKLGWYLVDLTVRDRDESKRAERPIARTVGAMLWLPEFERLHGDDEGRFALAAQGLPDEQWSLLPGILRQTGIERTVVSAWRRDTETGDIPARVEQIEQLLHGVLNVGGKLSISLHPVPRALIENERVNTRRPIEVLQAPVDVWRPFLAPILMRHAQRVREWQLGDPRAAQGLFDENLPDGLAQLHDRLRALAPQPRLLVPWRLDQDRRGDLEQGSTQGAVTMVLDVPPGVTPERIPAHLEAWQDPAIDHRLSLRTRPADELPHAQRVTDLALRMIHSWRAEPGALQLSAPWTDAAEDRPAILPDPLLGVFANVAHQLAGRRVVGELPIGDGLKCYILDGPAGGALVAWNVKAQRGEAKLSIFLGRDPVARDVWGNAMPLQLQDGRHQLQLERTPVFITGIDPDLARFRASFRVTPSLIESRQVPHDRTITLTNPWSRTISGHMQLLGPEGWHHQPSRHFFSIASGESVQLPVRLQFPIAEVAGPKKLRARFEFTVEQQYTVEMAAPMRLGLPGIGFDATVALESGDSPGAEDAVVACVVTNHGDEDTALYVFANLVGHPRQERLVSRLEPGQSVVRRFRFEDAGDEVRAHAIRTGVRETDGPAILNKRLSPSDSP